MYKTSVNRFYILDKKISLPTILNSFMKIVSYIILFLAVLISPTTAYALGNPVKISNSSNQTIFPQTVTDTNGYLHLTWMELTTTDESWSGHANPGIFYSRWNGDTWSSPLEISENTGFAEIPTVTSDAANTIHVAWDDETYGSSGKPRITYKNRSAAGAWSAIAALPLPTGTDRAFNANIATDSTNAPHVVFSAIQEGMATGGSIYWTKKNGSWSTPELLSRDASNTVLSDCQWSQIQQSGSGTKLHLIYWCWGTGIWYRSYTGSTWSTPVSIDTSGGIEYMKMAVTPAGEVFVSWFESGDSSIYERHTQSVAWQAKTILTTAGYHSTWGFPIMGVTTDSKNRTHVGWGEQDPSDGLVDLKFKTFASGAWSAAKDVDLNNADGDTPFVYPDKWDNQHFSWIEKHPDTGQWEIYYRVAEGTIQTVTTAGGTITANPNNITYTTITIPSGALSTTTDISVQIGPVPASVNQTQVTIPRAFTFRPHGLTFNSAVSTVVNYTEAELGGADERQLKPWYWNSQTSTWEAKTGTVNRSQNKITVSLNGFSLYGISAPIIGTPTWITPTAGETVKQGAKLIQFTLTYKDGSEIVPPGSPDELKLVLKNSSGSVVETLLYEPNGLMKDTQNNLYKGTLNFQKNKLSSGTYTLEAYLADTLAGTQTFTLER